MSLFSYYINQQTWFCLRKFEGLECVLSVCVCVSVYTRLEAVCRQYVDTSADTFRVQKKVLEPMKFQSLLAVSSLSQGGGLLARAASTPNW